MVWVKDLAIVEWVLLADQHERLEEAQLGELLSLLGLHVDRRKVVRHGEPARGRRRESGVSGSVPLSDAFVSLVMSVSRQYSLITCVLGKRHIFGNV